MLEDQLQLTQATETLDDEVRACAPVLTDRALADAVIELTPDLAADRAAVALSMRLLHTIEANLPGTLDDIDIEFLHDLRVAVRRTRSLQRQLKAVFPPERLRALPRRSSAGCRRSPGPTRDLDVYLLEFDELRRRAARAASRDLEPLRALLADAARRERRRMVRALRSPAHRDALARLGRRSSTGSATCRSTTARRGARRRRRRRATRIGRSTGRWSRWAGRSTTTARPRPCTTCARRARSCATCSSSSRRSTRATSRSRSCATLKALQDTLGRFQDREVQAAMLRSLGDEVAQRQRRRRRR